MHSFVPAIVGVTTTEVIAVPKPPRVAKSKRNTGSLPLLFVLFAVRSLTVEVVLLVFSHECGSLSKDL